MRVITILLALGTGLAGNRSDSRAGDITGSTYTSTTYDVSFTWDDTWFVIDETVEDYEMVSLTDGLCYASFYVGPDGATTAEESLAGTMISSRNDPSVSDFVAMKDTDGNITRGSIGERAYAAFSFTQTFEDGSTGQLALYIDVQMINPGESSTGIIAYCPLESFESEMPLLQTLAGMVEVDPLPDPTLTPGPGPDGESAPVFVSGFWRIAVVTTILNEEIPAAGLKTKDGNEWLVVIADITNWSEIDSDLSLREFRLHGEGFSKSLKVAPSSTKSVAAALGFAAPGAELGFAVEAGQSVRVALVFSVPENGLAPKLRLGDTSLPLADTLQPTLVVADLPAPANAPDFIQGEIISSSDGRTIRVNTDGAAEPVRLRLLGVEPPAQGTCFEHQAENVLDGLVGTVTLIETDSALEEAKTPARYIWIVNADGSRTLLNQLLIAEGDAEAATLPAAARFGLWLTATQTGAEEGQIGLWGDCPLGETSRNPQVDPASTELPAPTATSSAPTTAIFVTPESDDER